MLVIRGAVGIYIAVLQLQDIHIGLDETVYDFMQAPLFNPIVGVDEPYIFALSSLEARIACHAEALVVLVDDGDIGAITSHLLYDMHTVVLGAIVDDYQLVVVGRDMRLAQATLQAAPDVLL